VQLDALYSMIRTLSPETLIVLNGVVTLYQGDWDVICIEGWGAWGERIWGLWPFALSWPKKPVVESWRLVADPAFECSKGIQPDWQEYLRVQLSLTTSPHGQRVTAVLWLNRSQPLPFTQRGTEVDIDLADGGPGQGSQGRPA
jgi:hypothetical protein